MSGIEDPDTTICKLAVHAGNTSYTATSIVTGYLCSSCGLYTDSVPTDSESADADPTFTRDGVYYYCDISYTIDNTPTFSLPVTGVSGISVIPVIGAGVLAAVVCLFLMTRRRKVY